MYNPEQKHIILKNSFGVSFNVFYESGRGLCLRMLGESHIWSRGYILAEQAVNDFSVILDRDDYFHFIFQSRDGSLMYGHGKHGQIEIQPILNSKDTTPWPKHVSLLNTGNIIIFSYMLRFNGRFLVSMQKMEDNVLSKPQAIDYTDGPGQNYIIFLDSYGKCHIIYTFSDNSKMHIVHREMKEDFSVFNPPKTIYSTDGSILFPSAICDPDNNIHLLFQVFQDNYYEIRYKNILTSKSLQSLYKSPTPPGYSGLIFKTGTINMFRVSGSAIYTQSSCDGGINWANETLLPFGRGGELTCFNYFTNIPKEKKGFISLELPGNFSNGYKLAFLDDEVMSPVKNDMSMEENYINKTELNKQRPQKKAGDPGIKESTADDAFLKKIDNKILQLQNITENMQKEMTKHWLLFKELEKKLDKIIRSYRYPEEDKFEKDEFTDEDNYNSAPENEFRRNNSAHENKLDRINSNPQAQNEVTHDKEDHA